MAVNDFTDKNIQDTYQRVVQTDGTNLADGTGSLLPISFEGNDVIIPGTLRAQSYIISQSILNISSGSTAFGDTSDDTHTFLGHITASGNISSSGEIKGATGIFNQLALRPNTSRILYSNDDITLPDTGLFVAQNITASGTISASLIRTEILTGNILEPTGLDVNGYILSTTITSSGNISASGNFIGANAYVTHVTASGNISASGDLTVNNINGTINGGTF